MIYVPESEAIVVRDLGQHAAYVAFYFDPVSGIQTEPKTIQADADGSWTCPPPAVTDHDWVLILESKPKK